MSTEKDREAAEKHIKSEGITEAFCHACGEPWLGEMIDCYVAGIQHARQGERGRMIRLLCWHEDSYSDEQGLASKVDEFLEQEKSK